MKLELIGILYHINKSYLFIFLFLIYYYNRRYIRNYAMSYKTVHEVDCGISSLFI